MHQRSNRFLKILAIATILFTIAAAGTAYSTTFVIGSGAASFGSGASFNGVALTGLRFGVGSGISSNGVTAGDVQTTLLGNSPLGQSQEITVEGKATAGSFSGPGAAVLSGICTVDMGNGTAPLQNVPFILTVSSAAGGTASLTLVLGATNLPSAQVSKGSINVQ